MQQGTNLNEYQFHFGLHKHVRNVLIRLYSSCKSVKFGIVSYGYSHCKLFKMQGLRGSLFATFSEILQKTILLFEWYVPCMWRYQNSLILQLVEYEIWM
jgi:hypothetical protein